MTDQPTLPAAPAAAAPVPPPAWYTKTPGARPPQSEIVVNKDCIINRQGKDFVLYAGLLDAAHNAGLQGISTHLVQAPSAANGQCAIVHATAEFPWGTFTGIGDADTENTSRNIAPHRIRMAETRAKARCLRDALNVSMVAIEEMGPAADEPKAQAQAEQQHTSNGSAAPRPVSRPDGTSSVTSSPGTRKSYGTPMTRPPVQG